MGGLFGIFTIMGLYTAKSAKKVKDSIADEESNTDSIVTWAIENLTDKIIDSTIEDIDDCTDEEKYLLRAEALSTLITNEFDVEDESYINSLIEEIYPELFE